MPQTAHNTGIMPETYKHTSVESTIFLLTGYPCCFTQKHTALNNPTIVEQLTGDSMSISTIRIISLLKAIIIAPVKYQTVHTLKH